MQQRDHMDICISGETIIDLKYDVGLVIVQIRLQQMQQQQKRYGMIVIIWNDIIEKTLLK